MPAEGKTPLTSTQVKALAWWLNNGAPLTGNIETASLSKEDKKSIAQYLGLVAADNAWPLAKQENIPDKIIADLQQNGFLVKTIAKDINYLDVDYSSNLTAISDEAVSALVNASTYIVYLNLVNSQITAPQMANITKLTSLLKLRLNKTPVNDEGIKVLVSLPNLQYLNLFGTQVTDQAAKTLGQIVSLKQLYIGQTAITKDALTELSALKPEIKVYGLSDKLADFQAATQKALDAEKDKNNISKKKS